MIDTLLIQTIVAIGKWHFATAIGVVGIPGEPEMRRGDRLEQSGSLGAGFYNRSADILQQQDSIGCLGHFNRFTELIHHSIHYRFRFLNPPETEDSNETRAQDFGSFNGSFEQGFLLAERILVLAVPQGLCSRQRALVKRAV